MAVRVLGIDPGSRATGWALVVSEGNRYRLERFGVIRPRGEHRHQRLADLQRRLAETAGKLSPDCAAVESSFSGLNPKTGLALAESRGVILAVLGELDLPVESYSPAQIKSAVVGYGRADKQQISYMVVRLLQLAKAPPHDAADAMAIALTHIHFGASRTSR